MLYNQLPNKPSKELLSKMYLIDKLSGIEIAKKLHFKKDAIYLWLKKYGIPLREYRFENGFNVWATLSPEKTAQRKTNFRERMLKYNPMKNPLVAQKVALALKSNNLGEGNPNFKNGRYSFTKYGRLSSRKSQLLKQNSNGCELCGIKKPLLVHHKDNNRLNNSPDNLQVLCYNCHYLIHYPD